jgi:adenine specific DNA methylase Mod
MTKEQKFYNALQDVFIGAKIEGTGGFVNLMRIKSNYYRKIKELLEKDIEKALEKYPKFRDELFDKLYSFFSRYFTENGSIYFNSTPFHNNIYEKVYTDNKDVILFWKTQMLYYVKTDRIFRSLEIESDGFKFFFDVSKLEHKKANEKRSLIYELKEIKEDGTIIFNVNYSEKGRITKTEDILKELKKQNIKITEDQLERAFRIFEKQSEVDFFINKNAKAFLQEQFKLWSYQYFWEGAKEWSADRVNELQILKNIAFKIIDFVSQFEDELVKIWNKPKFVKNSNYVITLDRIIDQKLIKKILEHNNIEKQIKEWQELGIVDEKFNTEDIFKSDLTSKYLTDKYKHLPIDTKYFKELELEILSQFEDLDKSLDGWLIKSENYQALNTILPKFKEKVQTIYIDPPFNLDSSDQFLYRTNYKDANWATLLENRLKLVKEWLNEKGSIFVRCDYNGNWIVRPLMNEIFGEENFRNEIIIAKTKEFFKTMTHIKKFSEETESLFFFSKTDKLTFNVIYRNKIKPSKYEPFLPVEDKSFKDYRIIKGEKVYSPKGRKWGIKQEDIDKFIDTGRLVNEDGKLYLVTYEEALKNVWIDYQGYSRNWNFPTENSEILLKRVIESTSNEGDLVMDFFLGSGTTTAVAHKLKRKWISIEMGEHFYSVILPRIKKVLAYDKSGISKEVKEYQGGGFFKYYKLEQYEEALANTIYENHDLIIIGNKSPYEQYVFMKDEKMLKVLEIDYENNKVKVDLDKLYPNIDIAETLSNLTGKWIKKMSDSEVELEDGTKINTKDLDYKLIKPLIWWERSNK